MMSLKRTFGFGLSLSLLAACNTDSQAGSEDASSEAGETDAESGDETGEPQATYTYWRDAKAVIDSKCAGCHVAGEMAPFALTSYAEVAAVAPILPASIESGTMPPWPPADGCREYQHDRSLDSAEQELLLTWLAEGAPEGDPADAPTSSESEAEQEFEPDATLTMPEPYTPSVAPDDYRCFVIPWDGDAWPRISATSSIT